MVLLLTLQDIYFHPADHASWPCWMFISIQQTMPLDPVEYLFQSNRPCLLTLWNIYFNLADHAFWPCRILSSTQQTMPLGTGEYVYQSSQPCLLTLENICFNPADHVFWSSRILMWTQGSMLVDFSVVYSAWHLSWFCTVFASVQQSKPLDPEKYLL